jgi:hypothetical protein
VNIQALDVLYKFISNFLFMKSFFCIILKFKLPVIVKSRPKPNTSFINAVLRIKAHVKTNRAGSYGSRSRTNVDYAATQRYAIKVRNPIRAWVFLYLYVSHEPSSFSGCLFLKMADQAKIRFFLKCILRFRGPRKKKSTARCGRGGVSMSPLR